MEMTAKDRKYATGKLDPLTQVHLLRKIAPMMVAMGAAVRSLPEAEILSATEDDSKAIALFGAASVPLLEGFAKMPTEDVDYIVASCLAVCEVYNVGGIYTPIREKTTGRFMFDDIDASTIMRLCFCVIKENLGPFLLNPIGAILPSGDSAPSASGRQ